MRYMHTLIPVVHHHGTNEPIMWQCSACDRVFAVSDTGSKDVSRVNEDFREHSWLSHPCSAPMELREN